MFFDTIFFTQTKDNDVIYRVFGCRFWFLFCGWQFPWAGSSGLQALYHFCRKECHMTATDVKVLKLFNCNLMCCVIARQEFIKLSCIEIVLIFNQSRKKGMIFINFIFQLRLNKSSNLFNNSIHIHSK